MANASNPDPESAAPCQKLTVDRGLDDSAVARAAAGSPVLNAAKVVTDMAEASADLTRIYATTARPRGMEKPVLTARQATLGAEPSST